MKVSEEFSGNYLKAADLAGKSATGTIARVVKEILRDPATHEESNKWVVYFEGKQRGLVLNKTNAETLAHLLGDDSAAWIGKRIRLVSARVEMAGKMVDAIRLQAADAAAPPVPAVPELPDDDDEIPF